MVNGGYFWRAYTPQRAASRGRRIIPELPAVACAPRIDALRGSEVDGISIAGRIRGDLYCLVAHRRKIFVGTLPEQLAITCLEGVQVVIARTKEDFPAGDEKLLTCFRMQRRAPDGLAAASIDGIDRAGGRDGIDCAGRICPS